MVGLEVRLDASEPYIRNTRAGTQRWLGCARRKWGEFQLGRCFNLSVCLWVLCALCGEIIYVDVLSRLGCDRRLLQVIRGCTLPGCTLPAAKPIHPCHLTAPFSSQVFQRAPGVPHGFTLKNSFAWRLATNLRPRLISGNRQPPPARNTTVHRSPCASLSCQARAQAIGAAPLLLPAKWPTRK